jgi:signal transduction histidine kinase
MASIDPSFQLAAGASRRLREALDLDASGSAAFAAIDAALTAIVSSVVETGVADWCLLEVNDEGQRERRLVAVANRDPAAVSRARAAFARRDLARELGWSALQTAPLATRGRALGVLTLAADRGALAEDAAEKAVALAGLMAGALDTAFLCAERDEMLSVVSHDLRNPLGVILLVIDLLRGTQLPDEISAQMARLERASQTMSRIITDVVDVGRLGSPGVPLEPKRISAAAVVDEACQASAALTQSRSVRFDVSVDPALEITADRGRLARALDLLVSGAVMRTPPNRSVVIGVEVEGDRVIWSVADGAPPLPPDPAVATGPAAIRRRTGAFTWMVVRGVVRAHGGTVWIEETPVRVVLRFALPHAAAGSASAVGR